MGNRMIKILVIDDNQDNLVSVKALIKESFPDALVYAALSGRKGLELAASVIPDVILLDIVMPGMDGFEVCRRLKEDNTLHEIPVVFLTAIKGDKENRILALEVGAEAFLAKPIDESELTAQIRAMLKISAANIRKRGEEQRLASLVEERTNDLKDANLATLRILEELKAENEARKESEKALLQSEERFQLLFNKAPLGYQSLDINGYFIEVNQQWLDTLGYNRDEVIGKWFGDFLVTAYQDGFRARFPIFKAQGFIHSEFEMVCKNGNRLVIAFDGRIGYDSKGDFKQTHCILQDITERRKAEQALLESENKYKNYVDNAPDGIFVHDENGKYIEVNKAAAKISGYSKAELLTMSISDMTGKESHKKGHGIYETLLNGGNADGLLQFVHKNGSKRWCTVSMVKLTEHRFLGFVKDVTESKKAEDDLVYLSCHDQLTGLHNRRFFEQELKRLDKQSNLPLTVAMGDINGLKLINDSFGHSLGDKLLVKAAAIVKKGCRNSDLIARFGGDEFIIVFPRTDAAEATQIINHIHNLAANEKVANIAMSISFGYDTKDKEDQSISETMVNAENHMYRHKVSERSSMRSNTIDIIINTLFEKSNRESFHSKRVSEICQAIASSMDFEKDDISQITMAGLVHDIGKIGVDENILNKPGKLDNVEWEEMKKHPETGWRILSATNEFSELAQFILEHHEKWDGKGYPNGLKGEEIKVEARIIAVADAYDAMTRDRSYRRGFSRTEAAEEIKRCSGTQFDPEIVEVFLYKVLPYTNVF